MLIDSVLRGETKMRLSRFKYISPCMLRATSKKGFQPILDISKHCYRKVKKKKTIYKYPERFQNEIQPFQFRGVRAVKKMYIKRDSIASMLQKTSKTTVKEL
jgi:hypothetical protein